MGRTPKNPVKTEKKTAAANLSQPMKAKKAPAKEPKPKKVVKAKTPTKKTSGKVGPKNDAMVQPPQEVESTTPINEPTAEKATTPEHPESENQQADSNPDESDPGANEEPNEPPQNDAASDKAADTPLENAQPEEQAVEAPEEKPKKGRKPAKNHESDNPADTPLEQAQPEEQAVEAPEEKPKKGRKPAKRAASPKVTDDAAKKAPGKRGRKITKATVEHCNSWSVFKRKAADVISVIAASDYVDKNNFKFELNPMGKPRRGAFEITITLEDGEEVLLWSGLKRGPPRKEKFPDVKALLDQWAKSEYN